MLHCTDIEQLSVFVPSTTQSSTTSNTIPVDNGTQDLNRKHMIATIVAAVHAPLCRYYSTVVNCTVGWYKFTSGCYHCIGSTDIIHSNDLLD